MALELRLATLDDVYGIVDVYCSSVNIWHNLEERQLNYEMLSVVERWMHGEPWMSVETCAIHINYLLTNCQYPIVAVFGDKIVGELELFIGEEKFLGCHGYIDVIEVHRDFRRRGIGRRLVEKAIQISRDKGCRSLFVWPNPEAIEFYRKCSIKRVAFRIKSIAIDLSEIKAIEISELNIKGFPREYCILRDLYFISPRTHTSYVSWLKCLWKYALGNNKSFGGVLRDCNAVFYIKDTIPPKGTGFLYLWVENPKDINLILGKILGAAKSLGFNTLRLSISDSVYRQYIKEVYIHKLLSDEILLMKQL